MRGRRSDNVITSYALLFNNRRYYYVVSGQVVAKECKVLPRYDILLYLEIYEPVVGLLS